MEESKVWPNFKDGVVVTVTLTGIFLVPGRLLVAVGKPVKGLSEVPCVSLAKNNWHYGTRESMELCGSAVQKRGSAFRDIVG